MKPSVIFQAIFVSILTISLSAFSAFAQVDQGSIAGRVIDPTGAVVPGATISVINVGTNEKRNATSNGSGEYSFSALKAAMYKIEATAPTFAVNTITDIQLSVGQRLNLEIAVSPEAQSVTVDVVGGSETAINTSSARRSARPSTSVRSKTCRSTADSFRSFICRHRARSTPARAHSATSDFRAEPISRT